MQEYRKLSDEKLVGLLFTEEDRLPRAAVDELLRREWLVDRFGRIVSDPFNWNEPLPRWWAPVHAVYLLGAAGTAATVLPLLRAIRYAEATENDWVTEDLPSLLGRLGRPAREGLRTLALDRTSGWLARTIALEGLAAMTLHAPELEAETFSLVHAVFSSGDEDLPLRQGAGSVLLDFRRSGLREELAAFGRDERERADRDPAYRTMFTDRDVAEEYGRERKDLVRYTRDWLAFYDPAAIAERQQRWERERTADAESAVPVSAQELCPFAPDGKRTKCCLGKAGLA